MNFTTSRLKNINSINRLCTMLLFLLFMFNGLILQSQTMTYLGNGAYDFDTDFPNSDLHFYLFDDGYHSFDKNIIHKYLNSSLPSIPTLFHTEPYTPDDIEETSFYNVNDGVIYTGPISINFENQIEVKRSWNMVESKENYFILMFENINSSDKVSGCIEFHFDKTEMEIEEQSILDSYNYWVVNRSVKQSEYTDYTHKFKWEFYDLAPQEQRFIYLPAKCLKGALSQVNTRGVLKINECESIIPEDSKLDGSNEEISDGKIYTLKSVVSNYPHDPNCIVTNPKCISPTYGSQVVNYKVFFQNDGIDEVQNVVIDILTSGDISYENVKLINSSEPCDLNWSEHGLNINFYDIFLPGSNQSPSPFSYDETIGWVELELCFTISSYTDDFIECLISEGRIYFDSQPPVQLYNKLCKNNSCLDFNGGEENGCPTSEYYQTTNFDNTKITSIINMSSENEFTISPNYSTDFIYINNLINSGNLEYSLHSSEGVVLLGMKLNQSNKIDISELPTGLYFLTIVNEYYAQTKPFIKY